MSRPAILGLLVATGALFASPARAADRYDMAELARSKAAHPETEEAVASGAVLYRKHCASCHGDEGAGDGGAAAYLDPRPRDFTKSLFKFRSTKSGELPTDEDLFAMVSRGVAGTAMPAWGEGTFRLSVEERWQVSYFLKTFAEDFGDEAFDPYREGVVLAYPEPPPSTPERVARGREIFTDEKKGGCVKCHGATGRGNGPQAGAQRDDWGDAILAADLTRPRLYKYGRSAREVFRTLSTGLNGTPMPGYGEMLDEDARWDLAHFVRSLQVEPAISLDPVLVARRTEGEIPGDPNDEGWLEVEPFDVPLTGQIVVRPRHANAAVDLVRVRAMVSDEEIALHLSWNDRTRSVEHRGTAGGDPPLAEDAPSSLALSGIDDTFVPAKTLWKRRKLKLRDSVQVQLPSSSKGGSGKPFFFLGGTGGEVSQWRWLADRHATGQGRAFEERSQNGAKNAPVVLAGEEQSLSGAAHFDDGRWRVVVRRARVIEGRGGPQFGEGALVPFALQVWDGGNGEEGVLCAVSSWYYVRPEAPAPLLAYLAALLAFLLAAPAVRLAVFVARRAPAPTQREGIS